VEANLRVQLNKVRLRARFALRIRARHSRADCK